MILNYAKKYSLYLGAICIWIIYALAKIIAFFINLIIAIFSVLIEKTIISLFKKIVKAFEETIVGDVILYSDALAELAKKLWDKAKLIKNRKENSKISRNITIKETQYKNKTS